MTGNRLNNKIVAVTPGRFSVFDLAEYLYTSGRLAALYTGYPRFKLRSAKIAPELIRSFPWLQTPLMAMGRLPRVPSWLFRELGWQSQDWIDAYAARTLPECGLVTAMSANGLRVGSVIKRRGGVYVCERGSTHIRWQQRILAEEYDSLGMPWIGIKDRVIEKELAEYDLADAITLGSSFSLRSFIEMGVPRSKLRFAPYGTTLSVFRRTAERASNFRVLFVGQPSVRKGLHYLFQAFNRANLPGSELVLVGSSHPDRDLLAARFPVKNMTITGIVSRDRLVEEMSRASVLVVPSVEDGFAVVQGEALACGCPVIATTNTGAEDLFENGKEGFFVPPRNIDALVEKLTTLYNDRALVDTMAEAAVIRARRIGSWEQYCRTIVGYYDELLAAKSI